MPQLRALLGHLHDQVFPLGKRALIIGREPKCDVVLQFVEPASRRHAEVHCIDGVCSIRDLCSRNGTLVNGQPITEHILEDEDIIMIGENVFVFEQNAGGPDPGDKAKA